MRIISGRLGGRNLKSVEGEGYRPAMGKTREALFSMLAARGALFHGARVLDCYAGAGSVGIEALSRGARGALRRAGCRGQGASPFQYRGARRDRSPSAAWLTTPGGAR